MTGQMTIDEVVATHLHKAKVSRDPLTLATEWRLANPDAFLAIVLITRRDVLNGRTPSIAYCFELLRRPHDWPENVRRCMGRSRIERPEGQQYSLNNTARSALVRMIEAEFPDLNGTFRKHHSKADVSDGRNHATPVVPLDDHKRPDCFPCQDAALHGAWMCNRCEVATPHREVEPPA